MSFQRVSSVKPTKPIPGAFLSNDGQRLLVQYALSWGAVLLTFFLKRKLRLALQKKK